MRNGLHKGTDYTDPGNQPTVPAKVLKKKIFNLVRRKRITKPLGSCIRVYLLVFFNARSNPHF